ncbi:DUF5336 domain-containing protein [Gordonia sp. DT30]|uniref:DUF5336 domain-containing protein n=1 Tax=unclassified Gordonia (in: high G+C Gram-positive bacteria) TaxID=2657482 RepID=UPI003CF55A5D
MNPGDPNNPQPGWAAGQPPTEGQPTVVHGQHGGPQPAPGPNTQGFYPQPGTPSGQWSTAGQQWGPPPPPPRQFDVRAQLPAILLVASTVAGLITYFMGFVSWVVPNTGVSESELDNWSQNYESGNSGIPGFASYEIVLNPGKFLILLGAVAIAAALVLVPRFRRAVPFLAVIAAGAWLALFSAAVITTSVPVIGVGAGAIVALIFGFLQVAFLIGAAVLGGLSRN